MIEVHPNLFVGSEHHERGVRGQPGWFIVHACKEPYHRAELGYRTPGAPKGHPEYLIASRPGRLILNLVDAPQVAFIPAQIIDAAIEAIAAEIDHSKVLVHCYEGRSPSPTFPHDCISLSREAYGSLRRDGIRRCS